MFKRKTITKNYFIRYRIVSGEDKGKNYNKFLTLTVPKDIEATHLQSKLYKALFETEPHLNSHKHGIRIFSVQLI